MITELTNVTRSEVMLCMPLQL